MSKKVLSLILVLAMLCGLLVTTALADETSTTTTPSGYWTDSTNYSTSWYSGHESDTSYTLNSAAQLAGLAAIVNGTAANINQDDFSGKTVTLGENIDLAGHYWIPIGGASTISAGIPSGNAFAGTFDGNGKSIDNLYITYTTGDSGYGFFGSVKGGRILNVTLEDGSINVGTNSVSGIGALVGYCDGDIYNCHNKNVTVYMGNTSASMCGGIAGTVENLTTTPVYVQYCSNTAAVTGRGRVGGIVGAVYCTNAGGVVVDNCYNRANLITVGASTKSYTGGIVGYCRGYITNCYSYSHIETSGGHYQAGLAGLIQGYGPEGQMSNCYAKTTFGSNANVNYDRWLFGVVDFSSTMPLSNLLWVDTNPNGTEENPKTITQPESVTGDAWGLWKNVGYFYDAGLSSPKLSTTKAKVYSNGDTNSTGAWSDVNSALGVLNNTSSLITSSSTTLACRSIVAGAFAQNTTTNDGYPYLRWENDASLIPAYSGGGTSGGGSDTRPLETDGVILGGSSSGAYTSLSEAITAAANTTSKTVYVAGTIDLQSGTYTGASDVVIKRSQTFEDYLFTVNTGATVTLSNIVIDGNRENTTYDVMGNQLIRVFGGSLTLENTVTLRNADSGANGGALHVQGGTVNSAATITNCSALNGGAVYVSGGSLTLNGGSISGCSAQIEGDGIYVNATNGGSLTLNSSTMTIGNEIYLSENAVISASAAVPSGITVQCESPTVGMAIVSGSGRTLTVSDANKVSYAGGAYSVRVDSTNNKLVLAPATVYLDGTATTNGNGTQSSPYNNLDAALSAVGTDATIIVDGTTQITTEMSIGGYNPTIRRGDAAGALFNVNAGTNTVMVASGLVFDGDGSGTLFTVQSGTLDLRAGTFRNCDVAVDIQAGGTLELSRAIFNAEEYSIKVAGSTSTFFLSPADGIEITGTVYLGSGAVITVDDEILVELTVESAVTTTGTVIAQGTSSYQLTDEDLEMLTLSGTERGLSWDEDNNQFVIE